MTSGSNTTKPESLPEELDDTLRQLVSKFGLIAVSEHLQKIKQNGSQSSSSSSPKETEQLQRVQSSILEASFDPFFAINMEGMIQIVNQAAMDAFQYTKDELQGQNISLIVGGGHGAFHDRYLKKYRETGKQRFIGSLREVKGRRKDGTEFPCLIGIKRISREEKKEEQGDLLVAYIRDITEQKESEKLQKKTLAEQELRAALLDCSFDSMFAVNLEGTIEMVNAAAVKNFGYDTAAELCGNNISCIVGSDHCHDHDGYLKRYKETGKHRFIGSLREVKGRRKDGTEFPCVIGIKRVDRHGHETDGSPSPANTPLMVAFIRDITQQKEAERLQQALHDEELRSSLLDCSFHSIVAMNLQGVVQMVNKVTVESFGYTEAELRGQKIERLVSGNIDNEADYLERYRDVGELVAKRKNGEEFPVVIGMERIEFHDDDREPLLVAFLRDITEEKKATELEVEVRAAEELLCNMLPQEIADRLKNDPQHLADHHDKATILFADIVGFTAMSSNMEPVELVQVLNDLFTRFDTLVEQYGLNKVKTIGRSLTASENHTTPNCRRLSDARHRTLCYMVTSIPSPHDPENACCAMCHFALDMIQVLHDFNGDNPANNKTLDLRVGINTGPVVAGVVGTSRFLYDLWGDSVNLASRMESTGIPSRVQVTRAVVDTVGPGEFDFEDRGEVLVKGKGMIQTYFLEKRLQSRSSHYHTLNKHHDHSDLLDATATAMNPVPSTLLDHHHHATSARFCGVKQHRSNSLHGVLQELQTRTDAFNMSSPSLSSAGALHTKATWGVDA